MTRSIDRQTPSLRPRVRRRRSARRCWAPSNPAPAGRRQAARDGGCCDCSRTPRTAHAAFSSSRRNTMSRSASKALRSNRSARRRMRSPTTGRTRWSPSRSAAHRIRSGHRKTRTLSIASSRTAASRSTGCEPARPAIIKKTMTTMNATAPTPTSHGQIGLASAPPFQIGIGGGGGGDGVPKSPLSSGQAPAGIQRPCPCFMKSDAASRPSATASRTASRSSGPVSTDS